MDGASAMRQSTPNPQLQAQADVQMRESRRNIEYLDGLLRDLQMRQGMDNMSIGDRNSGGRHPAYTGQQQSQYQPYGPDHVRAGSDGPDYGSGGYSDPRNPTPGPRRGPFGPPGPGGQPKGKPNYSKLGMAWTVTLAQCCSICTDCPFYRPDQRQHAPPRSSNTTHALSTAVQAQRRGAVQRRYREDHGLVRHGRRQEDTQ